MIVLGLLLCGPKTLLSADSHDYIYEDPFGDGPTFTGSKLQGEAEALVLLLQERENHIRQGIDSKQEGASEEPTEDLSSLNNRIELLAQAKEILSQLSKFSSSHPEDQAEIERLKTRVEKAVDEIQKTGDQKNLIANLVLKKLSSNITQVLLEIAEHYFDINSIVSDDSKPVERFLNKLNKYLAELQKLSDLSSSDEKEKSQLVEAIRSRIKILENYLNIKSKNEPVKKEILESHFESIKLGIQKFADRFAEWTGAPSLKSKVGEGINSLEQMIKKPSTSQSHQESKDAASPEVTEKEQVPIPPIYKNEFTDPEKNGFVDIANLRSKYKETEKLKQEIESQLNSNKDLGTNLELQYRENLAQIGSYQQALSKQIYNAKFKSLEQFFPDVFSPLKKLENTMLGNSPASENTKSIKNEVKPDPSASSPSPSDSTQPPNKNNSSPSKQSDPVTPTPPTPKTTADNSVVGNSIPDLKPGGTQPAMGLDDNSSRTRISSFVGGESAEHRAQTLNANASGANASVINGGTAASKGSTSTKDTGKTTEPTNKNPRKIASENNSDIISDANQSNSLSNSYRYISSGSGITDPFSNSVKTLSNKGNPIKGFSKSETDALAAGNNESNSSKMGSPEDNNLAESNLQKFGSDNDSANSEAGFSLLRNRPKRNAKTGIDQQKRRSNEDSIVSNFASNIINYPNTNTQYDSKPSSNKAEPTYAQTPEKTVTQTSKNNGDISNKPTEKTEYENLKQISSDIQSGEMDTQVERQASKDSDNSIWEKMRLEPSLDLIGKIVSELYPPAANLKPSDITELLTNKKVTREVLSNVKSSRALEMHSGVKPNLPTSSEKDIANPSLLSAILAWLGFN